MNSSKHSANDKLPWPITVVVVAMRLVVGAAFVFSGWAKAIDPWGTFYKVADYLMALQWDAMHSQALFFAFALPVIEVLLGVALLLGIYRRGAPIAALALMAVMLPLTLWLATTNAVPDCGCFGDAWTLSNWASFAKNVLLTLAVVFLIIYGRKVRGIYGPAVQWMVMAITFVATMALALHGYFTQPLIDFRPFKVGTSLASSAPSTNDSDYRFVYEKDGVRQEFAIDSVPDEHDGWTFVARTEVLAKPEANQLGTRSIAVVDHGVDVTDELLENDKLLLLLFSDLPQVSIATTFVINELVDKAQRQGVAVYGLTSASDGQIAQWVDVSMAQYPMLVADDTEIKMMARGNPAVAYIDRQTIRWKRTLTSITTDRIHDQQLGIADMGNDMQPDEHLRQIGLLYALAMLALLLFNRVHLLITTLLARNKRSTPADNDSKQSETQES